MRREILTLWPAGPGACRMCTGKYPCVSFHLPGHTAVIEEVGFLVKLKLDDDNFCCGLNHIERDHTGFWERLHFDDPNPDTRLFRWNEIDELVDLTPPGTFNTAFVKRPSVRICGKYYSTQNTHVRRKFLEATRHIRGKIYEYEPLVYRPEVGILIYKNGIAN